MALVPPPGLWLPCRRDPTPTDTSGEWSIPGIFKCDPEGLEIFDVACHQRHSPRERRRCDVGIVDWLGVRHMPFGCLIGRVRTRRPPSVGLASGTDADAPSLQCSMKVRNTSGRAAVSVSSELSPTPKTSSRRPSEVTSHPGWQRSSGKRYRNRVAERSTTEEDSTIKTILLAVAAGRATDWYVRQRAVGATTRQQDVSSPTPIRH